MKIKIGDQVFEVDTEFDFKNNTLTILESQPETSFMEVSSDHKKFARLLGLVTHKEERWDEF